MTEARRCREGRCLVAPLVAAVLLLAGAEARAEPHFSARSGLRCSRCHVSPTGGGKRTTYGALYAMSQLTLQAAGPGEAPASLAAPAPSHAGLLLRGLATGEVTSWLAVGSDLRLSNQSVFGEAPRNSFEATQGTFYLELRPWPGRVLLYLDEELGAGGARTREAWGLIYGPYGSYLRGGRFLPPFGLRLLDDAAYTRRVTGANFANPDLGLEAGLDLGPLFLALAISNGSFAAGDSDSLKALWAFAELNLPWLRLGLSGLYNPGEAGCRSLAGSFAAVRLGRLVLQGELDLIGSRPPEQTRWGFGLASYLELDLLLTKGLSLRASWDFSDGDLQLRQDRRQRFRLGLDLFPLRMVELKIAYVIRQAETPEPLDAADLLEAVLHVYL